MEVVAFDTETHLFAPGIKAPRLVCASVSGAETACLLTAQDARYNFRYLMNSTAIVAGANLPFDVAVMLADAERVVGDYPELVDLVFRKYDRGEIWDVLVAEALDAIAGGHLFKDPVTGADMVNAAGKKTEHYSLEIVCRQVLGREDAKKNDFWRKRYAVLESVPIADWPPEARQYPVDDAVNTRDVALAQMGLVPRGDGTTRAIRNFEGMPRETRADLGLRLSACWGIRAERAWVERVFARASRLHSKYVEKFRALGFVRAGEHRDKCEDTACLGCKKDGPDVKRRVAIAYGVPEHSRCPSCGGKGKRLNRKGNNEVWCTTRSFPNERCCDGTGLDLDAGPACPRTAVTPKGGGNGVKADRDVLVESGDDDLADFGANEPEKAIGTYVPFLRQATEHALTLSPNVLVKSFRTSYSGPIQQFPTAGLERACVVARPGHVLGSLDYSGIELCTLAETCVEVLGYSRMADIINASGDPGGLHTTFGAAISGMSEEQFLALKETDRDRFKIIRDASKRCNFGMGGGMGPVKFVLTCRKGNAGETTYADGTVVPGIRFCVKLGGAERCGVQKILEWNGTPTGVPVCRHCVEIVATILKPKWLATFPEMPAYFNYVQRRQESFGTIEIPQGDGLPPAIRGIKKFTDAANGHFQGRAAIGAKDALYQIVRECYSVPSSPLYGSRLIFFVHDENVFEFPEDRAHAAAYRACEIMVSRMRSHLKHIRGVKVEPALMRRWLKSAEMYHVDGALTPWDESPEGRIYLEKLESRLAA